MTETEMNIAIAESCGWHKCACQWNCGHQEWYLNGRAETSRKGPPNYVRDLNARMKALKTMTPAQWQVFGEMLLNELGHCDDYYDGWQLGPSVVEEILTASAGIVLKCFLRTIGKWKD